MSAQGTDTPCLLRAPGFRQHLKLTFSPWFGPHGAAVENFAKQGQTAGIVWSKLATTIAFFSDVDVEPTMKLAAATVAWEAATKILH